MEEKEIESDLDAFRGELVSVPRSVPLEQPVTFQFSQIVPELVQAVGADGNLEGGKDGCVDLGFSGVVQRFWRPAHREVGSR
jgi:hypothetical protein